ncbi:response regulator [Soonwooa sp.]|uniref:LytR/AlgR family response regulator transcription factor n=1 Tax=Soonwooa sp. TaxID=1938592 RepID=UPI0028995E1B|nr:response regulator [Soonwooa sp.]
MCNDINAIIIDDEERARMNLKLLVQEFCPEIKIIAECKSLSAGVKTIRKENPALVFLDIEMPGHSGLELLDFFNESEVNFSIIFVTAYNNYAINAFKLSAIDYLLKPINPQDLQNAVALFQKRKNQTDNLIALKTNLEHSFNNKIAIPVSGKIIFMNIEDILYLKGDGAYTTINKTDRTNLLVSRNLKYFEDFFKDNNSLMRVHRSYIANLSHIGSLGKKDGAYIEFLNGDWIPIANDKLQEILNKVNFMKK